VEARTAAAAVAAAAVASAARRAAPPALAEVVMAAAVTAVCVWLRETPQGMLLWTVLRPWASRAAMFGQAVLGDS
jgi:hypothetical protein